MVWEGGIPPAPLPQVGRAEPRVPPVPPAMAHVLTAGAPRELFANTRQSRNYVSALLGVQF